jgi:hypothetical protein
MYISRKFARNMAGDASTECRDPGIGSLRKGCRKYDPGGRKNLGTLRCRIRSPPEQSVYVQFQRVIPGACHRRTCQRRFFIAGPTTATQFRIQRQVLAFDMVDSHPCAFRVLRFKKNELCLMDLLVSTSKDLGVPSFNRSVVFLPVVRRC